MLDCRGRDIHYLRISVTDRCNLRCVYCMPERGVDWVGHDEILTYEEILRLVRIFARLGIDRVRLTGGEPLTRKGLPVLIAGLKAIPGIRRVGLTTNGVLLAAQLPELRVA
ncbi:MAG: radical SAM protein, partial [Lawsonibacter sp.]|nr:radical SAM protein [Lawsonibacter sp.]